ncbi:MAG TPA: PEP-CTERM sorting domain-containing protein [Bryobacteraceae bacterium]|nr:PEP-CTERM sorting domain-containing protein [Bryobacteraceae bacterium]
MRLNVRVPSLLRVSAAALLLSNAIPARADLTEVNIFDNTIYEQTGSAAPTSPSLFFFSFGGNSVAAGDFTGGNLTSPNATLTSLPVSGTSFGASSLLFTTFAGLHTQFPFGSYTITGTGGTDGPQSETFSYPLDAFTTDIPALDPSAFIGLQGLNPTNSLTIGFNSFSPDSHANEAFTFFTIFDAGTVVFTEAFLSNSTTSVFLPANKLLPGTSYSFELDFSDRIRSLDGATGVTIDQGFDVRTEGSFTTGSAAVPEPTSLVLFGTAAGLLALLRRRSLAKRS